MLPHDPPPVLPDWLTDDDGPFGDGGLPFPVPAMPAVTPPPLRAAVLPPAADSPPLTQTPPPRAASPVVPAAVPDEWVRQVVNVPAVRLASGEVRLRLPVHGGGRGYLDCRVSTAKVPGVRQVQASRKPRVANGQITWEIGPVRAGESASPFVIIPPGPAADALDGRMWPFELAYLPAPLAALGVDCQPPRPVEAGTPAVVEVRVSNPGDSPADFVVLWAAPVDRPDDAVQTALGPVAAGGQVSVRLELPPVAAGDHPWRVWVEADGNAGDPRAVVVRGVETRVGVTIAAPESCLLEDVFETTVEVRNDGTSPVEQVRVECAPSDEFAAETVCRWEIARLAAGEAWTATVRLRAASPGEGGVSVTADGPHGRLAETRVPVSCRIGTKTTGLLDELLAAFRSEVTTAAPAGDPDRPRAEASAGERHILFLLGAVGYAVPIGAVREVIRPPAVSGVPGSPAWLTGVANVRGDVATVIDLPLFLALPDAAADRRAMLVVRTDDEPVGFLVDDVAGIRRMTTAPLDRDVRDGDHGVTRYLSGVADLGGRLVQVLDLSLVVSATAADTAA